MLNLICVQANGLNKGFGSAMGDTMGDFIGKLMENSAMEDTYQQKFIVGKLRQVAGIYNGLMTTDAFVDKNV